eukprot:3781888-Amphidinium_carterae.1
MDVKLSATSWQENCTRLLGVLEAIPGMPRDITLLPWTQLGGGNNQFRVDAICRVAAFVLGWQRRALDNLPRIETQEAKAKLRDGWEKYLLVREQWRKKEVMDEESFLTAFKCIVDSTGNVLRAPRFYEVTWDCYFWIPLWDRAADSYVLWVVDWSWEQLDELAHAHALRFARPEAGLSVTTAKERLLEWHKKLQEMDGEQISFPPRILRTTLTEWAKSVLRQTRNPERDTIEDTNRMSPMLLRVMEQRRDQQTPAKRKENESEQPVAKRRR